MMAAASEDRTLDSVHLDIKDSMDAGSFAHNFSRYRASARQHDLGELAAEAAMRVGDVRVAAPVGCRIHVSGYPAMMPQQGFVTIYPFPGNMVHKFVYNGQDEQFVESPQAFFHHATFSSGGKELVCDLQGSFDGDNVLLLDPCMFRTERLPSVGAVISAAAAKAQFGNGGEGVAAHGGLSKAAELFDSLHPRCSDLCHCFDSARKCARKKLGVCGSLATCGF